LDTTHFLDLVRIPINLWKTHPSPGCRMGLGGYSVIYLSKACNNILWCQKKKHHKM